MAINRTWYEKHRMPKNPSIEERLTWHKEHQKYCQCRPIPEKLLKKMKERCR